MAQGLRTNPDLAEVLTSIPSTHISGSQPSIPAARIAYPLLDSGGNCTHVHKCACVHMEN